MCRVYKQVHSEVPALLAACSQRVLEVVEVGQAAARRVELHHAQQLHPEDCPHLRHTRHGAAVSHNNDARAVVGKAADRVGDTSPAQV